MIAKIDADRARLAEVQDRLIRIDLRRRDLSPSCLRGGTGSIPTTATPSTQKIRLSTRSKGDLAREEADLRRPRGRKGPGPDRRGTRPRERYTCIFRDPLRPVRRDPDPRRL